MCIFPSEKHAQQVDFSYENGPRSLENRAVFPLNATSLVQRNCSLNQSAIAPSTSGRTRSEGSFP